MENSSNTNQDLIEIEINYAKSFLYQNEKGLWLVLNVTSINLTDEPQLTGYAFVGGKLCLRIIVPTPKIPKGKHIFPLLSKTVTATATNELFVIAPQNERNDTLVITNLEEKNNWRVGIGDKTVLIDKTRIENKTRL